MNIISRTFFFYFQLYTKNSCSNQGRLNINVPTSLLTRQYIDQGKKRDFNMLISLIDSKLIIFMSIPLTIYWVYIKELICAQIYNIRLFSVRLETDILCKQTSCVTLAVRPKLKFSQVCSFTSSKYSTFSHNCHSAKNCTLSRETGLVLVAATEAFVVSSRPWSRIPSWFSKEAHSVGCDSSWSEGGLSEVPDYRTEFYFIYPFHTGLFIYLFIL